MAPGPVNSIAWSPQLGLFVGVTFPNFYFVYSTNGLGFTLATTSVTANWHSVAWSPQLGIFVAVASNSPYQAYSSDGKNWTAATTKAGTWYGIAWSPQLGIFAAVGQSSPYFSYTTNVFTTQTTGTVLLPSGNLVFSQGPTVAQFNPVSLAQSNFTTGTDGYKGLVLALNGNVITVPTSSNIYVINPTTGLCSNIITNLPSNAFSGGALTTSGNIIFVSNTSANVGMFDPIALQYSNSSACGGNFSGATLLPSGQVVFVPSKSANVGVLDTFVPAPQEWCLSPYFNKF